MREVRLLNYTECRWNSAVEKLESQGMWHWLHAASLHGDLENVAVADRRFDGQWRSLQAV
jgi:hypothetical protein